MRLHIAAQPFPSHQGTQAVIGSMLRCEREHGVASKLLTYSARTPARCPDFTIDRPPVWPGQAALGDPSLRSGPSAHKILLDIQLLVHLRRMVRRHRPKTLIAHHVEAAVAALLCGGAPVVFFAHTDLAAELPTYGSDLFAKPLAGLGRFVDGSLCRRADAVVAISPLLAQGLTERISRPGHSASHVAPPFTVAGEPVEQSTARAALGLPRAGAVLAYVGNLDAYQGVDSLPAMLSALRHSNPNLMLLVATESDTGRLKDGFRAAGVLKMVRFMGLKGEVRRAQLHGAADVVLVPRRASGGLPIKLLDALARGAAVVASPAAVAGLPLEGACSVGELGVGMARCIARTLANGRLTAHLRAAGPRYVAEQHSPRGYLLGMQKADQLAASSRTELRSELNKDQ